jgi:hypothetical protein
VRELEHRTFHRKELELPRTDLASVLPNRTEVPVRELQIPSTELWNYQSLLRFQT